DFPRYLIRYDDDNRRRKQTPLLRRNDVSTRNQARRSKNRGPVANRPPSSAHVRCVPGSQLMFCPAATLTPFPWLPAQEALSGMIPEWMIDHHSPITIHKGAWAVRVSTPRPTGCNPAALPLS